jgi:hypothetical protein
VHAADIQDREGAPDLLAPIRYLFPWMRHVFADGAYAGDKLETALAGCGRRTLEIVERSDQTKVFSCCRDAGSSREPSLGLAATGGWPRISRGPSPEARHGRILLPSSFRQAALPDPAYT